MSGETENLEIEDADLDEWNLGETKYRKNIGGMETLKRDESAVMR